MRIPAITGQLTECAFQSRKARLDPWSEISLTTAPFDGRDHNEGGTPWEKGYEVHPDASGSWQAPITPYLHDWIFVMKK